MGQPRPLFRLFSVFSNKQYNFYNKYMSKNIHPVYGAGIQTHNLQKRESLPITTRPGLPPNYALFTAPKMAFQPFVKHCKLLADPGSGSGSTSKSRASESSSNCSLWSHTQTISKVALSLIGRYMGVIDTPIFAQKMEVSFWGKKCKYSLFLISIDEQRIISKV